MHPSKSTRFFKITGGRKQFNGYIATLLLTVMAPFLKAGFTEYSLGILGALGITSGLVALEDRDEKRFSRTGQVTAATRSVSTGDSPNGFSEEISVITAEQKGLDAVTSNGLSSIH